MSDIPRDPIGAAGSYHANITINAPIDTDGDDVCSVYDFEIATPAGAGAIPMAEWSVIRDGKLVSSRLLFDTAALAALMPAG